ncbi:hypothetical protein PilKf_02479 [Pillotina sp. SPG140]
MVPDVRGKELTAALVELQTKELYPHIQLRYSSTSDDKGSILEQEPGAGTIVKAGRRIRLVVSQGIPINTVESYIGRNIDEVYAEFGSLLDIQEPLMYMFSNEAAGIIIQQKPEPGTPITGPVTLEFVVSQGPEYPSFTVPNFVGLSRTEALNLIAKYSFTVSFSAQTVGEGERGDMIIEQSPEAQSRVSADTTVSLVMTVPTLREDEIFGIFTYDIPKMPYPLTISLDAILPSGNLQSLFNGNYAGGQLTVPYKLPINATLILSMLGRELHREQVTRTVDNSMFF